MKTAIYTYLFALLSISITIAQTSLEGKVLDATTGEAIMFSNVSLFKNDVLQLASTTDIDGNYFFSGIDPGIYDVEVNYIGYTPQRQTNVIVKADRTNRLDFSLTEGVTMDAVTIIEYKEPTIKEDRTSSGTIYSSEPVFTSPKAAGTMGLSSKTKSVEALSIRGSRSPSTVYYIDGVRTGSTTTSKSTLYERAELPESGQITAAEWNDLHNWKDWMELLEDESYSIMMSRFDIHPTNRYSVIVVNHKNTVLANAPVQLIGNDGKIIWTTYTDNSGRAELWENALSKHEAAVSINVYGQEKRDIVPIDEGSNTFVIDEDCFSPQKMDIVFTVDATSSMLDEINYLQSELIDVIDRIKETNKAIDFNLGSVFYRDKKDEYLTRVSPISSNVEETINFIGNQNALGGGDYPEALDAALEETLDLNWREDALKLVFLVLDAPPHEDEATLKKIRSQIKEAAYRGIKLIPVTASGINRETEFLMKFMSILTNGTYVFITDDSGIGNPHLDPVVDDYEVEKLNDCLVRLITQYSKSYSCDVPLENSAIDVNVYPNPATQYINIKSEKVPDKIKVYSANGMMVKSITPTEKESRIDMQDMINGIYTVTIIIGDQVESKQIILLK